MRSKRKPPVLYSTRFTLLTLFTGAASLAPQLSSAYSTMNCTGGGSQKWRGDESEEFLISNRSFPSGSADREIIEKAFHSWTAVRGSNFEFHFTGHRNRDAAFRELDGKNEVMYVSPTTLLEVSDDPNVIGVALNRRIGCRLIESDVIFSNELSNETLASTAVHEFGHALGLDHSNDYASMLPVTAVSDLAHPGTDPYKPLPDDRQGLRHLYPSSRTERDVGASKFLSTVTHLEHTSSSYSTFRNMCPGDAIIPIITTLNYGNRSEEFQTRYFAAQVLGAASFRMDEYTTSMGSHRDYTRGLPLTVPYGLSPGVRYNVYQSVDSDRAIEEHDESNNIEVVTRLTVAEVSACPGSYATFSRSIDRDRAESASLQRSLITYEQALAEFKQRVERAAPQLKISEMYAASTGIYIGRVKELTPFRGADEKTIYTHITLDVFETLRGKKVSTIQLRQAGGTIEDESLWIEGAPQLAVGDEIIAIVGRNGRSMIPFVGGEKGVLRIQDTPVGKIVLSPSGKEIVGYNGRSFELARGLVSTPEGHDNALDSDRDRQGRSSSISMEGLMNTVEQKTPLPLVEVIDALKRDLEQKGNLPIPQYEKQPASEIRMREEIRQSG